MSCDKWRTSYLLYCRSVSLFVAIFFLINQASSFFFSQFFNLRPSQNCGVVFVVSRFLVCRGHTTVITQTYTHKVALPPRFSAVPIKYNTYTILFHNNQRTKMTNGISLQRASRRGGRQRILYVNSIFTFT